MDLFRRTAQGRGLLARVILAGSSADGRPTPVQRFAARRPVALALYAGTPIGVIIALAARPVLGTASGVFFVAANWVLVTCAFALVAFAERARQRLLDRVGKEHPSRRRELPGRKRLDL
ncbi:hypothetical protein [Streptomyces sp. NPDC056796]|uniref:hypothetical protein n=1 Tax=unclassified Streptomyces TaxID=2593676 RepID=UPI0036AAA3AE